MNRFLDQGWQIGSTIRLGMDDRGVWIELIFEKERPELRTEGRSLGIDRGFRKAFVTSDGQEIGAELRDQIRRKDKRSKKAYHHIKTELFRHLKRLKLKGVKTIVEKFSIKIKRGTMRMSTHSPIALGARILVSSLILGAFGLFSTGSTLAAKNRVAENATANVKAGNSQRIGHLIVTGSVTVNDKKAITGTTIFTDSHIVVACAKGSSAIVNLGRLGRVELTAGAKLTLRFGEGLIGGDLAEGKAVVSTPAGVRVAVNTPDGVASSGGGEAAVTPVVAQRGVKCVPVLVTASSSTSVLSNGAVTAAILGVAGGTAAVVAIAVKEDEASQTRP